jgi:peptide/nickel transport system substrate-binding protein
MFNDFVDAVSDKVQGYESNPNAELMDGFAAMRTHLA